MPTPGARTESNRDRRPLTRIALLIGAITLITVFYREVPDQNVLLNKVAQYLYFLPIVIAGLWYGWMGGVLAAVTTSLFYLPGLPLMGPDAPSLDQYGEALDLLITGSVVGILANRERSRTRELQTANEELRETYRRLEQSIEKLRQSERFSAVGQLAANMAHELRNPLASVEGAADLLESGKLDQATQAEFLEIIKKESRRLSRLLSDLLDFARPRSPEFIAVPPAEMLHSIVQLVAPMAQKSGVQLQEKIEAGMPAVECDPAQMKQVILNLVINAIQAMPGGGEIELRAYRNGNRAILEVRDQGSGVAQEVLDQLFIPFYTTKKDGIGLGLPIAQQMVLGHGGTISVTPNQPRGSVFSVTLPLRSAGEPA